MSSSPFGKPAPPPWTAGTMLDTGAVGRKGRFDPKIPPWTDQPAACVLCPFCPRVRMGLCI